MRIVGIIIIILVLGFFGGYGIMQSQIDDQKEFKGVKNVIPMDNRTEQQIEQHDVKVEKSGIISKEQAEIIVLENGNCVGMGKHKELLKTCKVYQEIAYSQISKEELDNA